MSGGADLPRSLEIGRREASRSVIVQDAITVCCNIDFGKGLTGGRSEIRFDYLLILLGQTRQGQVIDEPLRSFLDTNRYADMSTFPFVFRIGFGHYFNLAKSIRKIKIGNVLLV